MSICTLNIYNLYWFFKQWEKVNDLPRPAGVLYMETDMVRPWLRAVFGIVFCYALCTRINDVSRKLGLTPRLFAAPLAIVYAFLMLLSNARTNIWWFGLFSFVPLLAIQAEINRINARVVPTDAINSRFSKWNIAVVVPGILVLLLALIGTLLPPEEVGESAFESDAVSIADTAALSPTDMKLRELLNLATDKALKEPASLQPDLENTLQLLAARLQKPLPYSARRVEIDLVRGESTEWRLDYAAPDKLHILQSEANGRSDEWITIAGTRYHNAPPNAPTGSPQWEAIEQSLLATYWLDRMRRRSPVSGLSYRVNGRRYIRLEYAEGFEVWIDPATNFLAKVDDVTSGIDASGAVVRRQVRQAFSAHDEPIVIGNPSNQTVPFHP